MRRKWKIWVAGCVVGVLAAGQLTGCAKSVNPVQADVRQESTSQETSQSNKQELTQKQTGQEETTEATLAAGVSMSVSYKKEDLDASWEEEDAAMIRLEDDTISVDGAGAEVSGRVVTIKKAGAYIVSGTLKEGQIIIDAGKEDTVKLILAGMEISNSMTSPIYGASSEKLILTLADGTINRVSDGSSYVYESAEEDEPNAAIFTKDDLTINGNGSLTVEGNYECGIRSKDDLIVVSGILDIQAVSDGLKGKDSVVVRDGTIQIQSGKDGIKSNNDVDADKGYIWIDGGEITIEAGDDGIQAEGRVVINGGFITVVKSDEAVAGKTVDINGGNLKLTAQDDGMNAAATAETEREKMMNQEGVYIRIAGGELEIDASADGLDSNGDFYLEGGMVRLWGPTGGGNGILDYNGNGIVSGGTLVAAGTSDMMKTFGEESSQNTLVIYYNEKQAQGTEVQLLDEKGNTIVSCSPGKEFDVVIITAPDIETGKSYQVKTGDQTAELEATGKITTYGTSNGQMGGRGGGRSGGGERGQKPGGEFNGEQSGMDVPPEDGAFPGGNRPERRDIDMPEGGMSRRGNMPEGETQEQNDMAEDGIQTEEKEP